MYYLKKNKWIPYGFFIFILLVLISCSEKDEASDFEKLGATVSGSGTIQGTVINYSDSSALSGVSVSYSLSGSTTSSSTETE